MATNYVFCLDTDKRILNPVPPREARHLLTQKKAAVFRRYPFTIILKDSQPDILVQNAVLKLDPGSKVTGIALVQGSKVIWAAELQHRGQAIKSGLESRAAVRRNRRSRKTRYREARFKNRKRGDGWLAPSLQHRVETVLTWVKRLCKFAPVGNIAVELVRFDTQKIENPEISGVGYQQGELQGYEVREYLLEKWGRQCVYCKAENIQLQVEHIHPRSKGGSDRVSNLTIACGKCNQAKGSQDIKDFLKGKPDLLKLILSKAKAPLKEAAAVNSTRWALFERLKGMGLPVHTGSGGRTKYNRTRMGLPKTHWVDAACVGEVDSLILMTKQPLIIKADGWGSRQMCHTNKYGFPIRHRTRNKVHYGFQTGDIAKAVIPKGKNAGVHVGRVICRKSGSFALKTSKAKVDSASYKYFILLHRKDGYSYSFA